MKYYAVYKGKSGAPKIYTSWDECKKEVIGFKGAIYKSFKTEEEAIDFIAVNSKCKNININNQCKNNSEDSNTIEEVTGLCIYVDGSFSLEKGNYSFGLVAVENGEVIHKDYGVGFEEEAIALRNVSGEVLGAEKAVEFAVSRGYSEVTIAYDYQGIESWAIGTWKRNKDITIRYNDFMQQQMKKIKVNFKKIKGHSGHKYNDMADELAKKALGI